MKGGVGEGGEGLCVRTTKEEGGTKRVGRYCQTSVESSPVHHACVFLVLRDILKADNCHGDNHYTVL